MKHHGEKLPTHQLKEVFCAELPSSFCQNQIRTSGKLDGTCLNTPSSLQLATELHSLSLSKRSGCTNHKDTSRSRRARGGDEFSVSVKPIIAASKASECKVQSKLRKKMQKIVATNDDNEICISHSSLTFDSTEDTLSTLEVFALSRSAPAPDQVATTQSSRPTHVKSTSETSCGISLSSSVKEGDVGANIHDDPAQAPTYYLLVKIRFVEGASDSNEEGKRHTGKSQKTISDNIPLDFNPSLVHITELQLSSNCINSGNEGGIPLVGIFIANDNKLQLYIAKKDLLRQRCLQEQHPIQSPCFVLSSLFFYATNDSLEVSNENPQDPFVFSSSITSLDTFHDGVSGDNKLAVGLFDGTIQTMTYHLRQKDGTGLNGDNSNNLEELLSTFQRTTFIVDGPVTTLHFGRLDLADVCSRFNQEPMSNLFLVAGSLCGFACLFYEMPAQEPDIFPYFEGPLPIVDELYDPSHDNEDCVTSAHACCSNSSKPMIAVGTQRGRVLLYQRTTDPSYAFDESTFFKSVVTKRNNLVSKMTEIRERIKGLQAKKDEMQLDLERLELSMAMHREMESLLKCAPSLEITPDEPLAADIGNMSAAPPEHEDTVDEDGDASEHFIGDIIVDASMTPDVTTSAYSITQANKDASLLQSKIMQTETELAVIQQKITARALSLETQQRYLDGLNMETRRTLHSSLRRMHRYELVCQCQLPYPILGIHYHFGVLLIFTRRSIHMFRKALANYAQIEERLIVFEKKLAGILTTHAP